MDWCLPETVHVLKLSWTFPTVTYTAHFREGRRSEEDEVVQPDLGWTGTQRCDLHQYSCSSLEAKLSVSSLPYPILPLILIHSLSFSTEALFQGQREHVGFAELDGGCCPPSWPYLRRTFLELLPYSNVCPVEDLKVTPAREN